MRPLLFEGVNSGGGPPTLGGSLSSGNFTGDSDLPEFLPSSGGSSIGDGPAIFDDGAADYDYPDALADEEEMMAAVAEENGEEPGGTVINMDDDYFDDGEEPLFSPPLYIQRYCAVENVIESFVNTSSVTSLLDLGCAELKFMVRAKNGKQFQRIVGLDLDEFTVGSNSRRIQPGIFEMINKREQPLKMEVYCGDATVRKSRAKLPSFGISTVSLIVRLIGWLSSLLDQSIDWLIDWLIERLIHWFIDWLDDWLIDWLIFDSLLHSDTITQYNYYTVLFLNFRCRTSGCWTLMWSRLSSWLSIWSRRRTVRWRQQSSTSSSRNWSCSPRRTSSIIRCFRVGVSICGAIGIIALSGPVRSFKTGTNPWHRAWAIDWFIYQSIFYYFWLIGRSVDCSLDWLIDWLIDFIWSLFSSRFRARGVTQKYPAYNVQFQGVGYGPDDTVATHGCCSQIAVFLRDPEIPKARRQVVTQPHKIMRDVDYPWSPPKTLTQELHSVMDSECYTTAKELQEAEELAGIYNREWFTFTVEQFYAARWRLQSLLEEKKPDNEHFEMIRAALRTLHKDWVKFDEENDQISYFIQQPEMDSDSPTLDMESSLATGYYPLSAEDEFALDSVDWKLVFRYFYFWFGPFLLLFPFFFSCQYFGTV